MTALRMWLASLVPVPSISVRGGLAPPRGRRCPADPPPALPPHPHSDRTGPALSPLATAWCPCPLSVRGPGPGAPAGAGPGPPSRGGRRGSPGQRTPASPVSSSLAGQARGGGAAAFPPPAPCGSSQVRADSVRDPEATEWPQQPRCSGLTARRLGARVLGRRGPSPPALALAITPWAWVPQAADGDGKDAGPCEGAAARTHRAPRPPQRHVSGPVCSRAVRAPEASICRRRRRRGDSVGLGAGGGGGRGAGMSAGAGAP